MGVTGKFNLTLSGADNATYSGTFFSAHDHDLLWDNTVTGKKVSATVPTDAECFRADLDYLKDDAKGLSAGSVPPTADFPYDVKSFDAQSITGSYMWVYEGEETRGSQHGNCYIGTQPDVCTTSFYETGSFEGISLVVAKNATFFFESWFSVGSLSQFNPAHSEDETDYYHNAHNTFMIEHDTTNADLTVQRSGRYVCTALWTEELENKCFAPETTSEAATTITIISESSQARLNVGLVIVGVFALFGLS